MSRLCASLVVYETNHRILTTNVVGGSIVVEVRGDTTLTSAVLDTI